MPNAIFFYRISRWLYINKVLFFPKIFRGVIFLLYNSKIPYVCNIGKGTFLVGKGIGVAIVEGTEIGSNCKIGVNVVCAGRSPYKNLPKIGDNVWIGPGAVIAGPVIIGNNVIIAPNAVVNNSVPENKIVGGIPAKIIGDVTELDYNILKNPDFKLGYSDYLIDNRIK